MASAGKHILVVGCAGDGKSTLINNLKDQHERSPRAAKSARGVTREVEAYNGRPLQDGTPVTFYDTPGVGGDFGPLKLMAKLEGYLKDQSIMHGTNGGFDAVLVTAKTSARRINLGQKVVQLLVNTSFVGRANKYDKVILVGTHYDVAEEDEEDSFTRDLIPTFFADNNRAGKFAFVSKTDAGSVWQAISNLSGSKIQYQEAEKEDLTREVVKLLGGDEKSGRAMASTMLERSRLEAIQQELTEEREQVKTSAAKERAVFLKEMEEAQKRRQAWVTRARYVGEGVLTAIAVDQITAGPNGRPCLCVMLQELVDCIFGR